MGWKRRPSLKERNAMRQSKRDYEERVQARQETQDAFPRFKEIYGFYPKSHMLKEFIKYGSSYEPSYLCENERQEYETVFIEKYGYKPHISDIEKMDKLKEDYRPFLSREEYINYIQKNSNEGTISKLFYFKANESNDGYFLSGIKYKAVKKFDIINIPNFFNEKPVVGILNEVFKDSKCKSLELGNNLRFLGKRSFSSCQELEEVIGSSESLEMIDEESFCNCKRLKKIEALIKLKEIGNNAFNYCSNLVEIEFFHSLKEVGSGAFRNCESFKKITFPDSLESIGSEAFMNCTQLEYVKLPESIVSISDSMFKNCKKLKNIIIPSGVTSIFNEAFSDCKELQTINFPKTISKIGCYAFRNCNSLTTVVLPENINEIEEGVFINCTSLKELLIPKNIVSISSQSFCNCKSLADLTFENSQTVLDEETFKYCIVQTVKINLKKRLDLHIFNNLEFIEYIKLEKLTEIDINKIVGSTAFLIEDFSGDDKKSSYRKVILENELNSILKNFQNQRKENYRYEWVSHHTDHDTIGGMTAYFEYSENEVSTATFKYHIANFELNNNSITMSIIDNI
ncbi:MAG: leucine-rich repeat domain-containing protein [Firmicutes bacterium]|nr:leucine-rich repeat domain-containing protein [Bacillota bacterium]